MEHDCEPKAFFFLVPSLFSVNKIVLKKKMEKNNKKRRKMSDFVVL